VELKATGTTAAAVDSLGHAVEQAVADVVNTAASTAVSHVSHANAMAICSAESAMPTCVVTTVQHSEIADTAGAGAATSTAGSPSRAGSTVLCAVWQYS
jgi:hypothetical protein